MDTEGNILWIRVLRNMNKQTLKQPSTQQNKTIQSKSSKAGLATFVDNRPETVVQQQLQSLAFNSPQVAQTKAWQAQVRAVPKVNPMTKRPLAQRKSQSKIHQLVHGLHRQAAQNNQYGGLRHHGRRVTDHGYSTRFRRNLGGAGVVISSGQAKHIIRSIVKREVRWWNGSRPSFTTATDTAVYGAATSRVVGGRTEYLCVVGPGHATAYLPRKRDRNPGEDYATIGHRTQWMEYIQNHAPSHSFRVRNRINGDLIARAFGITQANASAYYNATANLRLEGQTYNSQIAHHYTLDSSNPDIFYERDNLRNAYHDRSRDQFIARLAY